MLKSCIIGYGNIGAAHKKGYDNLSDVKLSAVCDIRLERRELALSQGLHAYENVDEMLEKESPDFVDICLPTPLHCEYTVRMLNKGFHVLCEKPMGRTNEECDKMIQAAKSNNKHLMIGLCLRYDGYYQKLKEYVDEGKYGKVTSANLYRISPLPAWGYKNWFADESLSGGALLDMSVHDIDICRYIFGEPRRTFAATEHSAMKNGVAHTELVYDDKVISVCGDWGVVKSFPFKAGFRVNFEKATLTLDGNKMTLYTDDEVLSVDVESRNHMSAEIEYFSKVINGEASISPEDSAKSIALIKQIQSELNGKIVDSYAETPDSAFI